MRRAARALPVLAVVVLALAVALSGCAASSNTTSSGPGAPGAGTTTSPSTTVPSTTVPSTSTTGSPTPPRGGPSALSVNPAVGSPHTTVRFTFTSPAGGAAQASGQISSALTVVGPRGTGCVGAHEEAVPSGAAGRTVSVAVGPAELGGSWCAGTYTARVEVVQRPNCGPGMMCPQFLRVVAVLGPVTFRIAG